MASGTGDARNMAKFGGGHIRTGRRIEDQGASVKYCKKIRPRSRARLHLPSRPARCYQKMLPVSTTAMVPAGWDKEGGRVGKRGGGKRERGGGTSQSSSAVSSSVAAPIQRL